MEWREVVENPNLNDLPFKIELNEYGKIVMNPVKVAHSLFQPRISNIMEAMREDGTTLTECAIWTKKGTKVADVAWASFEVVDVIRDETEASIAPEVCVEILSISNTEDEIKEKRKLYFGRGAKEVWICDEYGRMSFYSLRKKLKRSLLFPSFPVKVELRKPKA